MQGQPPLKRQINGVTVWNNWVVAVKHAHPAEEHGLKHQPSKTSFVRESAREIPITVPPQSKPKPLGKSQPPAVKEWQKNLPDWQDRKVAEGASRLLRAYPKPRLAMLSFEVFDTRYFELQNNDVAAARCVTILTQHETTCGPRAPCEGPLSSLRQSICCFTRRFSLQPRS